MTKLASSSCRLADVGGLNLSLTARYQAPGVGVNPLNVVEGAEALANGISWLVPGGHPDLGEACEAEL